jgi:pimeloyl-ACP methyl ester carboxylesterase
MVLAVDTRGDGRPIVLLPWFGLSGAVMAAAFEPVFSATSGWRRIYVDLPGTGRSAPVAPNSDAVLDAVRDTVDSIVGAEPYLLAGCSYGGYLATGLIRRAPAPAAGLLLVCAGVKIRPEDRDLREVLVPSPQRDWLADVPDGLRDHFRRAVGHQTRTVADRIARAIARNGPSDDGYLEALRSTGYQLSDEGAAMHYAGSVCLLAGREDRVAGFLDQFAALSRYPKGSYLAMSRAGHYLPFEQPERFKAVLLDWLAQTGLPRRPRPQTPQMG